MFLILRAGILIGVSAFLFSCDLSLPKPKNPEGTVLLAPASNELYVSGSDRLTMSEFEALRAAYPKLRPDDLALLAMDSQWLARLWKLHGNGAPLREAARCVRALLPPEVSSIEKSAVTALLSRAFGLASLEELDGHLRKVRQNRTVEWNPNLIREYGLQAKP